MTINSQFLNDITRKWTAWNSFGSFVRDPAITQGHYRPTIRTEDFERYVLAIAFDFHMEFTGQDKTCYRGGCGVPKLTPVQVAKIAIFTNKRSLRYVKKCERGFVQSGGATIIACDENGHRIDDIDPEFFTASRITGKAIKEYWEDAVHTYRTYDYITKPVSVMIYGDYKHWDNCHEMMEGWEGDWCHGYEFCTDAIELV